MDNDYISNRLEHQIDWYDEKSISAKTKLFRSAFLSVICTSLIPIITIFTELFPLSCKLGIVFLTGIVNICTWYSNFNKFQEIKIQYRTICEQLKTQKYLYENSCLPYNDPNTALNLLIINCENIMDEEHAQWSTIFNKDTIKTSSQSIGS